MDIDKENAMASSSVSNKKPKTTGSSGYQMPWIEKYRPITLDEVVGNEETVERLQAIAEDGNLPNLILSGPPGTGKVSREVNVGHSFDCPNLTRNLFFSPTSTFVDDISPRPGSSAPRKSLQRRRFGVERFGCSWY